MSASKLARITAVIDAASEDVVKVPPAEPVVVESRRRSNTAVCPTLKSSDDLRRDFLVGMRSWLDEACSPRFEEAPSAPMTQAELALKIQALTAAQHVRRDKAPRRRQKRLEIPRASERLLLPPETAGNFRAMEARRRAASRRGFERLYADPASLAVDVAAVRAARSARRAHERQRAELAIATRDRLVEQCVERARAESRENRRNRRLQLAEDRDNALKAQRRARWLELVSIAAFFQRLSGPWVTLKMNEERQLIRRTLAVLKRPLLERLRRIRVRNGRAVLVRFLMTLKRQTKLRDAIDSYLGRLRLLQSYWRRRLLRHHAELRICREQWDRLEAAALNDDAAAALAAAPRQRWRRRTTTYCRQNRRIPGPLKDRALLDLIRQVHREALFRFEARKLGLCLLAAAPASYAPPFPTGDLVDDNVMLAWIRKTRDLAFKERRTGFAAAAQRKTTTVIRA